jgi:hypothetical protein
LAFGLDNGDSGGTPRDGTLQAGEIDVEYDTCHGQGGATGAQGAAGYNALLATTTLLAGEMSCAEGGSYLTWGLDNGDGAGTARDGTLQSGEVDGSEVICNGDTGAQGVAGPATLTSTFDLDPGVTCSNGGLRLDFGGDDGDPGGTAGDGILDPQEIDDTKIICNGVDGSSGNTGSAGYNSLVSTSSNVGPNCATTGLRIDTGLDNGDGAGTARDGTLQAGEIDQTSYVCDGQDGGGGIGMGTILDANNVNLGTLIDFGDYGVTGMTSEGYLFSISWQGAYFDSQIYSSQAACGNGGSLWLNAGTTDPSEMFAKSLVYYGYDDNLYVPANANANGVATSVAFSAASLWNYGSCSGAGNNGGWLLSLVTRASVGLPATITAPLTLQ